MVPSRRILRTLVATLAFFFFVLPTLAYQTRIAERIRQAPRKRHYGSDSN